MSKYFQNYRFKYKRSVKTELDNFGEFVLVEGDNGTLQNTPLIPNFIHATGTPKDSTEPKISIFEKHIVEI